MGSDVPTGFPGTPGLPGAPGFVVPSNLASYAPGRGPTGWVSTLPESIERLRRKWSLEHVGAPFEPGGQTAWVAPALSRAHGDVVLKVARRHYEAFDEANGLRAWEGEGAVRLLEADDVDESTTALLVERCRPGDLLSLQAGPVQDEVIAGLLRRLWRRPPLRLGHRFRPLQQMCDQWADACERMLAARPGSLDPGLMRDGVALFRSLPGTGGRQVLLCTDLHAGNVLAAEREPWLMIDPKPYVGDPHYDVLQHVLNSQDRLAVDPFGLIERMAGLLDLDAGRVARWLFARCVVELPDHPELLEVARRLAP